MFKRVYFWRSYFRGHTPWDTQIVPPEIVMWTAALPARRALDLGCGTGATSVYLAARGWTVTGIDYVTAAIKRAKRRSIAQGAAVTWRVGDVTRLDDLTEPSELIVDVGCFHGLTAHQRVRYSNHVNRLAAPGAHFLLYAFEPHTRSGRQIGVTRDEVLALFAPAFTLDTYLSGQDSGNRAASTWYKLISLQRAAPP